MTALNITVADENRSIVSADASSLIHAEPTAENADLYTIDLPEYTQLATSGEVSVDAEAMRSEKAQVEDRSPAYDAQPSQQLQPQDTDAHGEDPSLHGEDEDYVQHDVSNQENPSQARSSTAPVLSNYLTEPVATASLASVRACSILKDRPAVWLVKQKSMALSPLAAAVLTKEGVIQAKDLQLISQYADMKRNPTDPVSAMFLTTYDVVSDMMLGVVAGPIELGKQTTPMLMQHEDKRKEKRDGNAKLSDNQDAKESSHVARQVALGTAKGFGRMVTTSLKSPAVIMHGITGYSSVGVYKSISNTGSVKDDPVELVWRVGEIEYQQASDADKLYIVRLWCQTQMRVRIG